MKRAVTGLFVLGTLLWASVVWASLAGSTPRNKGVPLANPADLKAELTGVDYRKLSEDDLYIEFLNRYQTNRTAQLDSIGKIFLSKYPVSVHADNVLYLQGYSALERKKYSEALRHFDMLTKRYPKSNKAVSAEFAKGTAYKHMKLRKQAQQTFLKVRQRYPGSPESYRAESELKILTMK